MHTLYRPVQEYALIRRGEEVLVAGGVVVMRCAGAAGDGVAAVGRWTVWPDGIEYSEADRFLRTHDGSGTERNPQTTWRRRLRPRTVAVSTTSGATRRASGTAILLTAQAISVTQ